MKNRAEGAKKNQNWGFWNPIFTIFSSEKNVFFQKKFFEVTFLFCVEGSMVPMITLRISKMFSWVRRTFWEEKKLADCISGHFTKQSFLGVLSRFSSFLAFFPTIVDYLINKCWKKVFEFKSVGNSPSTPCKSLFEPYTTNRTEYNNNLRWSFLDKLTSFR